MKIEKNFMNLILSIILITVTFHSCGNTKSFEVSKQNQNFRIEQIIYEIPQGKFKYEIYFAEFGGRMSNRSCDVEINGNEIILIQDESTNLSGEEIFFKGKILKHKSGKWILTNAKEDIDANEIGGCTEIPIIDFDKKLIEWC